MQKETLRDAWGIKSWRTGRSQMKPAPRSSRREFLTGRSALRAAQDLVGDQGEDSQAERARDSCGGAPVGAEETAYLLQLSRRAMACEFQIFLNAGQHPQAAEAALEALELLDALEEQLSFFRQHSEISRINRLASSQAVCVERWLFDLLQLAVSLYETTEGAFDVTAGPLSEIWGFCRREGRLPGEPEIREALQRVGSCWLDLDASASTIRFGRQGMGINLGAIGKGYALDRCAEVLRQRGIEGYLIHGGQSSILGRGDRHAAGNAQGWRVALRHPLKPDQRLAEIWLRDRALGTSGAGNQFFYFRGRRYGHILDPRTGRPAEELLSATALAPTAAQADALATAFFVMGAERTRAYCRARGDLAALLVVPGERAGEIHLETVNLGDGEWQQLVE